MERKGDFKLRQYLELERHIQEKWENEKIFEEDAPSSRDKSSKSKFLATFPYPYMNGQLHLGHSFSFSKAEVSLISSLLIIVFVELPFIRSTILPVSISFPLVTSVSKTNTVCFLSVSTVPVCP